MTNEELCKKLAGDPEYFEMLFVSAESSREPPPDGMHWLFEDGHTGLFVEGATPETTPTTPTKIRLWGKGFGYPVRGAMDIATGHVYFYRTAEEDEAHRNVQLYGRDAREWLERWDAGKTCHTLTMGGLGPGYEQCIHVTAAEIIRYLLKNDPTPRWENPEDGDSSRLWSEHCDHVSRAMMDNETVSKLGLSGAQFGAAMSIAHGIWRQGPVKVMTDERYKDHHIMVSKGFPS